jgi:hypothetical protein
MIKENDKYVVALVQQAITYKVKVIDRENVENPELHVVRTDSEETAKLIFSMMCKTFNMEN